MRNSARWFSTIILGLVCLAPASAQHETVYMSVLSSHNYRLNVSDNPIVGIFVSTDRGQTWQHKGWTNYIRVFYTEPASDGTLWSACGNGVLRSTDGGDLWSITTGWQITEVLKVRPDPRNPHTVYAATAYGLFKTTDNGASWINKPMGLKLGFTSDVIVDREKSGQVFAATEDGVFRSTNGGKSWARAGLEGKGIRTITQDPTDPKILWVGTESDGVFRSSDEGHSWVQLVDGLKDRTVYAIAIRADTSFVYVGTHDGGVYVSKNRGAHWEQSNTGLTNLVVHSLVILPSDPRIIFAGTLNGGLFRSTNGGSSWEFNSQEEGQVWGLSVGKQ